MKITKHGASAGSSERRKDAEDDASELRGRKSQKPGTAAMKQRTPLLPISLLACRMRAERLTVSMAIDRWDATKLSRDASHRDSVMVTTCGTTCQPSGTR